MPVHFRRDDKALRLRVPCSWYTRDSGGVPVAEATLSLALYLSLSPSLSLSLVSLLVLSLHVLCRYAVRMYMYLFMRAECYPQRHHCHSLTRQRTMPQRQTAIDISA